MAGRIIFEDDIEEQNVSFNINQHKSDVNTHQESSTVKGNSKLTNNNLGNIEQDGITSKDLNDIQLTDSGTNYNDGLVNESKDIQMPEGNIEQDDTDKGNGMGNIDQPSLEAPIVNENKGRGKIGQEDVMVDICQSPIEEEGKHHADLKRRLKKELAYLGADVNVDDVDSQFDVFGDDSKIFKKYKLRRTEKKISYKEPTDFKPELYVTPDNKSTSLVCTVCYEEFETKRSLHIHQRYHSTILEYTCSQCNQKFNKNDDLIAHKSTHNTESFLCIQCKVAFSDHCDYLQHNLTHSTESQFTCPECGLKYNKTSYKLHIWTHFNKKFNCHMCSYVGNGESNLQNHINQTHVHNKTCVECGRVFHNTGALEYHMISHTGVKKVQCYYCGKCFGSTAARKLHMRLHTGEKPYTCDICGHKSAQSNDMKLHKTTHETEKKYSCDLCHKKYFYKEYLKIHMRSHTQESLYECPECDGKFVNPSGLKTHYMFKHLSERPVECSVCNKHFINNNQYRKHTRSKYHKRNMYGHIMNNNGKECE